MTSDDVAKAVEAWATEELPDIAQSYDYIPVEKGKLPDLIVDVARVSLVEDDDRFPQRAIQQTSLHVFDVELSLMVDNADPQQAAEKLRSYENALTQAMLRGDQLGGRVDLVSPYFAFDFTSPFLEYEDGTRGRELTAQITVAEPVHWETP